jgi:hypothetical protein
MLRRMALVRTDVTHVVLSSPILVTLMMEAISSSETWLTLYFFAACVGC